MENNITVNLNLLDELVPIILWIGIWGLFDILLNNPYMYKYRVYVYIILILLAIYFKL